MSTQTQQVRTVFTWDTTDADKGVQRLERALERAKKAEQGHGGKTGHGGGKGGGNLFWAFHDFAEGRTMNAMMRLSAALGPAGVLVTGAYMLGKQFAKVREHAAETARLTKEIEVNSNKNIRTIRGSFSVDELGKTDEIEEQRRRVGKIASDNREWNGDVLDIGRSVKGHLANWWNNPMAGPLGATDAVRQHNELDTRANDGQNKVRQEKLTDALGEERAHAAGAGPGGSPFAARLKELEVQKKQTLEAAKLRNYSEEQKHLISQTFELRVRAVQNEKNITRANEALARRENIVRFKIGDGSARGGASEFSKKLGMTDIRAARARDLLKSGGLTHAQRESEQNNLDEARGEARDTIMGRYLNANGTKRRQHAIQSEFRHERNTSRKRARFIANYERGGIDPITGRRRSVREHGLHSGGLTSGGLHNNGGLDKTDFSHAFDLKSHNAISAQAKNTDAEAMAETMKKMHDILNGRLPKAGK